MLVVLAPGDGIIPLGESQAQCESGGRRAEARLPKGYTSASGGRNSHFGRRFASYENVASPHPMRSGKLFPPRSESLLFVLRSLLQDSACLWARPIARPCAWPFRANPALSAKPPPSSFSAALLPPCPARRLRPPSRPSLKAPPTRFSPLSKTPWPARSCGFTTCSSRAA